MVAKKHAKKVVTNVSAWAVETKVKAFAKSVEKEADYVTGESKEFGNKIWSRRQVASTEEKIYTIIGIVLLIWGVYSLKQLVRGGILIVVGLLFVTGFFIKGRKGK